MRRWVVCLLMTAVLAFGSGSVEAATQQANTAMSKWKTMDVCARQAQKAFPDFSADSNAKRDAALKNCLNANNLPPREPMSPPAH